VYGLFNQIETHFETVTTELFGQVVIEFENVDDILRLIEKLTCLLLVSRDINYVLAGTIIGVTYAGHQLGLLDQNHWAQLETLKGQG
jgi:hypothetical protein